MGWLRRRKELTAYTQKKAVEKSLHRTTYRLQKALSKAKKAGAKAQNLTEMMKRLDPQTQLRAIAEAANKLSQGLTAVPEDAGVREAVPAGAVASPAVQEPPLELLARVHASLVNRGVSSELANEALLDATQGGSGRHPTEAQLSHAVTGSQSSNLPATGDGLVAPQNTLRGSGYLISGTGRVSQHTLLPPGGAMDFSAVASSWAQAREGVRRGYNYLASLGGSAALEYVSSQPLDAVPVELRHVVYPTGALRSGAAPTNLLAAPESNQSFVRWAEDAGQAMSLGSSYPRLGGVLPHTPPPPAVRDSALLDGAAGASSRAAQNGVWHEYGRDFAATSGPGSATNTPRPAPLSNPPHSVIPASGQQLQAAG